MKSNRKQKVYLAGSIAGLTQEQATTWRNEVKGLFNDRAEFLDPMDGKILTPENGGLTQEHMTPGQIFTKDLEDVHNCNLVFANMLLSPKSIGTWFEIGVAWKLGTPVILVIDAQYHMHPFVGGVDSLDYVVTSSLGHATELLSGFLSARS